MKNKSYYFTHPSSNSCRRSCFCSSILYWHGLFRPTFLAVFENQQLSNWEPAFQFMEQLRCFPMCSEARWQIAVHPARLMSFALVLTYGSRRFLDVAYPSLLLPGLQILYRIPGGSRPSSSFGEP